jgi:virginiamycin B lyase
MKLRRALLVLIALFGCTTREASPARDSAPTDTPFAASTATSPASEPQFQEFEVAPGSRPHDVAPAPDGGIWYTAQGSGELGRLDPSTSDTKHVKLGQGSAPHGVIVGPDGAPWITDSGLNAIVRVDPSTSEVKKFNVPRSNANLNTAAFSKDGALWFTGQSGIYGRVDPVSGEVKVFNAPKGRGPYGIDATPQGDVWFSSLAGSYIALIKQDGTLDVFETPTSGAGARRVWSDSSGRLWVSEWNAGNLARFVPTSKEWKEIRMPGNNPQPYAVYVDDRDIVWISDFGSNTLVSYDPDTEEFRSFPLPSPGADIRQLLGRKGELWGAESGVTKLVVLKTS